SGCAQVQYSSEHGRARAPRSAEHLQCGHNATATTTIYTLSLHDALPIFHHTRYETARALWTIPADRWQVALVLLLALAAPLYLSNLYLGSYLLPWLIWSAAALALTLLMGRAGQLHFGFAAVMAIGAYSSIHLVQIGRA